MPLPIEELVGQGAFARREVHMEATQEATERRRDPEGLGGIALDVELTERIIRVLTWIAEANSKRITDYARVATETAAELRSLTAAAATESWLR